MANSFHMEPEEKQFLEYMFKKCYDQWIQENPQAKEYEIGYAQNKIIHELVWRIKPIGAEMSDFINHNLQETPWPEDHNQKYNQGMQSSLSNFY